MSRLAPGGRPSEAARSRVAALASMFSSRSVLAIAALALAGLTGCETRIAIGARCEATSECASPLVCVVGRCRAACTDTRQCEAPAECIVVDGVGGCRVPDDVCATATDCTAPLACIGSVCATACESADDCSVAQVCVDGACARRPDSPCDALTGSGCGDGERCTVEGCVARTPGETFDATLGAACDDDRSTELANCGDGLACVDGVCRQLCLFDHATDTPGSSCGAGRSCRSYAGSVLAPDGFGYCGLACDPVVEGSCGERLSCGLMFEGPRVVAECEPYAALDCATDATRAGCAFQLCAASDRCATGLDCAYYAMVDGSGLCAPLCDASSRCPSGSRCEAPTASDYDGTDGLEHAVSFCAPTCDVDATGTITRDCVTPGLVCDVAAASAGVAGCREPCASDDDCHGIYRCEPTRHLCVD